MNEDGGQMCEAPINYAPKMMDKPSRVISVGRRRELMDMAEAASDWILQHNIKPHELCFFKRAVEMLTDARD